MLPTAHLQDYPSDRQCSRVNGNGARNGGNGHHRIRHQIHNHRRRTALKGDTAVMLVESGMSVAEAVERCSTTTNDYSAMKALKESGNVALYNHVLKGNEPVRAAGKRVANAAAAITAFKNCSALERELFRIATGATADLVTLLRNSTSDQLVAASRALGSEWVWNEMIEPAMEIADETTTVEVLEAAE